MVDVYRITKYNVHYKSNANDHEIWEIEKYFRCKSIEEAEEFVDQQTRLLPEFQSLAATFDEHAADILLDMFRHNQKYIHQNIYFVGPPPIDRIRAALKNVGLSIERR